ncbi:MAG: hypothetical protein N4A48_14855 [Tepidibacter sp.]|jgi:hypothetical protein|uniref:hypothetical protein n=1 Tax=Tepidibacter sp. TaxID=2529387 RepID=UPI0025D2FA3A|nr:hypothetical protein [Tepidibacter sp.]MCT4510009.1 hypothetical protein [Tepidibacter sp.]
MWLVSFITVNKDSIIISTIFLILGIILPLLITKKKNDVPIHNNTSVKNVIYIVQQQLVQVSVLNNNTYTQNPKQKSIKRNHNQNHKYSQSKSTDDDLFLFAFVGLTAVSIYSKFHSQIMYWFAILTLFAFVSVTTLTILLYRNDNLDRLNQLWISIMVFLIISDAATIFFMSYQSTIINGDINILLKALYYLIGFLTMMIPNIYMLILLIHIFALNSFLVKQGKISEFILRKTHFFVDNVKFQVKLIIFITIFSLSFTSGAAYYLVGKLIEINNNNANDILETIGI